MANVLRIKVGDTWTDIPSLIGPTGPQGPQGPQGPPGEPGTSVQIHICSSSEYDATTRIPTVQNPDTNTFYLVPAEGGSAPDLFVEWIYANNAWEQFGSATVEVPVQDVQVNGTSVLSQGVANVPMAGNNTSGVVKLETNYGLKIDRGILVIQSASAANCRSGGSGYLPIVPNVENAAVFFGLAKAAGDTTQTNTGSNAIGTYTPEAISAIQRMLGINNLIAVDESSLIASKAYAINDCFLIKGELYRATAAIAQDANIVLEDPGANCAKITIGGDFVKKTDIASRTTPGIAKVGDNGIIVDNSGFLRIDCANSSLIKNGTGTGSLYIPIAPYRQHESVFYGLAKAAGANMKDIPSVTVGIYPEAQKSAISDMLNGSVSVSGSSPSITAKSGVSYVCGEVTTLDITVPESGCFDVIFESGSIATALTITVPTGYTLDWSDDFDPSNLDADTTYEINIKTVGTKCLGVAASWT